MLLITGIATMLISFEGVKYVKYPDQKGISTVCMGHTGKDILDRTYSLSDCKKLLNKDILYALDAFETCIGEDAPNSVKKAYVSAIYNVGRSLVCSNTKARKFLLKKDYKGACNELLRWNKIGKKVSKGLVNRRKKERDVCMQDLMI